MKTEKTNHAPCSEGVVDGKKRKQRRRSVITFVVAIFLASSVITLVSCWYLSMADKMKDISGNASDRARSVAELVNEMYSTGLLMSGNPMYGSEPNVPAIYPPLNEKRKAVLSALCNSFGFKYLYLFSLDEEKSEYTYIFVVSSDEELNREVEEKRPYGTVVHVDSIPASVRSAAHGIPDNTLWEDNNQFGRIYGWAYPLEIDKETQEYLVLAAEYDAEELNSDVWKSTLTISLPIIGLLVLNLAVLLILIRHRILKPIKTISSKMNSFAEGDEIPEERLEMKNNDEIGEIAGSFNKMSDDIREYITNINELTTYRVQSGTQMEIAERIQYGIVPEQTELSENGADAFAIEKPAKLVGGDFYDCFMRDGNSLCIVAGDVSGKGITAALFMVMVKTSIREKLMSGMIPAEVLNRVNDEVCASNPEGMFATVFAGVLDIRTGLLRFANAGHTAPVFIDGTASFLRPDPGIAIGLFEDAGIKDDALLMNSGSGIVLYTDGVTEAVDSNGNFYGEERILDALNGKQDSSQAVNALKSSVLGFYSGSEQSDDLTILSVFFKDSEDRLLLRPDLNEQDRINDLLRHAAGGSRRLKKLILVCEELFTNIVSYSGADRIVFSCRVQDDTLNVEFIDNGKPFDPLTEAPAEKDFDELDMGGMGIALVKQIAYKVAYSRAGEYNSLGLRIIIDE